ncbi:hypothetical protein E2C01_086359 [Portunus trituberculatus]|uniref:Uncharacterized protein n=1 Tax=Portunus trituberculatus TaxID=210409 RepID=A0A5B7J575_PORTR|nr:hypothetical protein [Portunus trituberculatus]
MRANTTTTTTTTTTSDQRHRALASPRPELNINHFLDGRPCAHLSPPERFLAQHFATLWFSPRTLSPLLHLIWQFSGSEELLRQA